MTKKYVLQKPHKCWFFAVIVLNFSQKSDKNFGCNKKIDNLAASKEKINHLC